MTESGNDRFQDIIDYCTVHIRVKVIDDSGEFIMSVGPIRCPESDHIIVPDRVVVL